MLLGDKITYYRKQRGLTQEELGKGICAGSYISKFEKNKLTPNKELLDQIRNKLGISGVPLMEEEINKFKEDLKEWHYKIKNRLHENALIEQPEIERKANASLESDIITTYMLYYSKLLLGLWRFREAKPYIDRLLEKKDQLSSENRYYLFYISGIYYVFKGETKDAMAFYKKAEEMEHEVNIYDSGLYYAISNLYTGSDQIFKAIYYANKAIEAAKKNSEKKYIIETEILLAMNYKKVGEYKLAEEIYKSCLPQVIRENNKLLINIIYHNLACVYVKMKLYEKAVTYFELSFNPLKDDKETNLYIKLDMAYMLLEMGDTDKAVKNAEEGLLLAQNLNNRVMEVLFKLIINTNSLDKKASLLYVESEGIPALINEGMYLKAIEYYNVLSAFYEDKNTKASLKKALEYYRMVDALYKKIMKEDEEA